MSGEERILEAIGNIQKDISELKVGQEAMQKQITGLETGQKTMQKNMDTMQRQISNLEAGQETMQKDTNTMQSKITNLEIGQTATAQEFANLVKIIGNVRAELKQDISDSACVIQKDLKNFKSETNRNFKLVDTRLELFENQMNRKFNEFENQMNKNFNSFKTQMETRCSFFENEMETKFKGFTDDFGTKLANGFEQVNGRIDNLILGGVDYILQTNEKVKRLEQQVKLA